MGKGKAKPGDVHGGDGKRTASKSSPPSTLTKVWFSDGLSGGDDLVSSDELGAAPFALAVEYVPPVGGRYGAKLVVIPKDADVVALIDKHGLRKMPVFADRAVATHESDMAKLKGEYHALAENDPVGGLWSPQGWGIGLRFARSWVARQRAVGITLATLLDGIEVQGSMEEVRRVVREVTMAIDKIAAGLETGATFDAGGIRVFAPGTRTKTVVVKPGVPPSEWGN